MQEKGKNSALSDALPTRLLNFLDQVLIWVALIGGGLTLIAMTMLSVFNVLVMRKALNAPIYGAEDVLVLGLVVVVALSIPFGARVGSHIEIELLESRMSPRFGRWSLIVMKLIGALVLAILSWQLMHAGANAQKFGESSQNLLISFGPFYQILSVWVGIYFLVLVLEVWQLITEGQVTTLDLPHDRESES